MALDQESYTKMRKDAFEQLTFDTTIALDDSKMIYSQKTYYGRVNRLYFRLCYYYCETCKELGNLESVNNQECLSCLPEYSYDYYYYVQNFYYYYIIILF